MSKGQIASGEWRVEETLFAFRYSLIRHSRSPCLAIRYDKGKKEAERRQTCQPTSASRDAARTLSLSPPPWGGAGHARLSAFHHGSYRQGFRPLGATPGQASWDVAGRSILYGRSNRGAKILRSYTGVTRARLSQSRECTSRTGHSAGQMMPEAARVRSVSFRARAPPRSTSRNTLGEGVLGAGHPESGATIERIPGDSRIPTDGRTAISAIMPRPIPSRLTGPTPNAATRPHGRSGARLHLHGLSHTTER